MKVMKFSSVLATSALITPSVFAGLVVKHSVNTLGRTTTNGLGRIRITSKIINDGNETVTVANHPQSVVGDQYGTNIFKFESERGKAPKFTGISVKWDPFTVKEIVIGVGETRTFVQDVSDMYDFSESGESTYTVSGGDIVYTISPKGKLIAEKAEVQPATIKISANEAERKRYYILVYGSLGKRSSYPGCSSTQISIVKRAVATAQKYIRDTLTYTGFVNGDTPRYSRWFGAFDAGRRAKIMNHFSNMVNDATSASTSYDCSTCSDPTIFSYVYPDQPYKIYLCGAFWMAPSTGVDSKAGTIVRGLSHFIENDGIEDIAYGWGPARALAISDPGKAVMNADSYEYYAENIPFLA